MRIAITNTMLVMPDHMIPNATLICDEGRIVEFGTDISTEGCEIYDAKGAYTGPGLMDIHTHAADLTRFYNDAYHASDYLLAHGVTDVLAATAYSRDAETLMSDIKAIKEAIYNPNGAKNLIGIYMEGPYLNVNFGANKVNHPWAPTVALERFKEIVDEAMDVTLMWVIAPERENIDEYVDYIRSKNPNARFAVGHSEAEPWQIERFIPKGLCDVTHHTNATGTLQNYPECRTACVDEAAHYNDALYTELICDKKGIHVQPYILRLVKKIKGDDKIILISDGTDTKGPVSTRGDFRGVDDLNFDFEGEISGTRLSLDRACRNMMIHTGASLCQVFKYASRNPAMALGLYDRGEIRVGNRANLTLVDAEFNVKAVFLNGEKVY